MPKYVITAQYNLDAASIEDAREHGYEAVDYWSSNPSELEVTELGEDDSKGEGHNVDPARRLDTIGSLTVTDEHGNTRTVTIRREDLTTTNGAYRAIQEEVAEALRETLLSNRAPQ